MKNTMTPLILSRRATPLGGLALIATTSVGHAAEPLNIVATTGMIADAAKPVLQ